MTAMADVYQRAHDAVLALRKGEGAGHPADAATLRKVASEEVSRGLAALGVNVQVGVGGCELAGGCGHAVKVGVRRGTKWKHAPRLQLHAPLQQRGRGC